VASPLFGSYNPSGTYNFFPSNAEIMAQAFERLRIKRTEIEQPHIINAVAELNLFLAAFNNAGPNLAQVDSQSIALVQGTASYSVLSTTIQIMDVILQYPGGGTVTLNQYMYPLSRTEYVAIPNPAAQGKPNQYWFDRLQSPTINLYPVPDGNGPYTLVYYRFRQVQDATLPNGVTPEVPNRALDAIVAGLAHRLSRIYAPDLEDKRKMDAQEAWSLYARQDVENADLLISPSLSNYYRI
jgi:hypothetical protein